MFVILQKYDFSSKSQLGKSNRPTSTDVCDTAKVRFFKQITTLELISSLYESMFVILQKYDFSSKSQQIVTEHGINERCLWYCKSTIFQANHNKRKTGSTPSIDVCDTAKVRFFKQITTHVYFQFSLSTMFVILQKYDFSSKSQLMALSLHSVQRCLWYCKSTIFQANHNRTDNDLFGFADVCDTAKVRFFKQNTTPWL